MGRKVHSSARFVVGTNVRDGRSRPSDVNLTAERRMEFGTVFECEAGEESGASRGGQGEGTDLRYGTTCPYEPPRPPLGLVRVQSRLPASGAANFLPDKNLAASLFLGPSGG